MRFRAFIRFITKRPAAKKHRTVENVVDQNLEDKQVHDDPMAILFIEQHLGHFPDDILHLIIQVLKCDNGIASVKPLSLVSRRFRALCLTYLFRDHCWRPRTHRGLPSLLPSTFWNYIRWVACSGVRLQGLISLFRFFHLILDGKFYGDIQSKALDAALPKMTSLSRFKLSGTPHGRWQELLRSVASVPQLSSLEFVGATWGSTPLSPHNFVRLPTRLVLHLHGDNHSFMRHWPEYLKDIISQCSARLEYLELCGNSLPLDLLRTLEWPCLREFVICGHSLVAGTLLADVVVAMPRLSKLDVSYRCEPQSGALVLWPPPSTISSDHIFPELTTLAIAHPSVYDGSFIHLPTTLQSFSILARSPPPRPLDRDQLFSALRSLRATELTTLRIVIEGPLNPSLFFFLNSKFPLLEVLGIHRFSRDQPVTESAVREHHLFCFLRVSH
jgi:hypothetical protein